MKRNVYAVALGLLGLSLAATPASAQKSVPRTCASDDVLKAQLAADPALAQRMQAINQQALQYAALHVGTAQRTSAITLTIPVVVHVLYSTASENISDAQIQSQIDVLNEDYHKLNSDYSKTPSAFAGLVADVGIQFTLAKRNPSGVATTGIERKSSTTTNWGTADKIKSTSTGGLNAWPAGQYLNLWVGTIGGGILGYAQFPGGAAATDGVVISPVYFGRTGTVTSPYNLGRTASHEVGHWLNLNHIWGDDNGACTGTDNVSDTPNQGAENYGKPTFPHVSCSNGPNGDMFMNYMDYVDDNAMFMFSTGQSQRMNALFASGGARASLLTSQGGVAPGGTTPPPTVTYCASQGSSVAYEYVDLVQLGSINRSSGADGGYYNGTALSTSLAAGSAQTLYFSAGFTGSAYSEYVKVYIDYNQNGVFTDAGELVVNAAASSSAATRQGSFTVPTTAKTGATRLRVVLSDNSATTSCGSYSYGETEDYTVNITGGTARTEGSAVVARNGNPNALPDQYTLFPNPATDVLRIARPLNADPEQPFTVRVFDLRGAEIKGLRLEDGQLNVAELRTGIYMLSVSDGSRTTHQRFVKQ